MRLRKLGVLATALSLGLVAAACGDDSGSSATTAAGTTAAGTTAAATTAAATTAAATTAAGTTAAGTTAAATTAGGSTSTTTTIPPRGDADLVIWADNTRAPILRPIADAFAKAEGVKVSVIEVPFDSIRANVSVAGPAGQGPDVFIGANDWLGELVKNGAVAPIDLGSAAANYQQVAVKAFNYSGRQYGLPYATENVALIRNTSLVPTAPATFDDLEKVALQLKQDGKVDVPLAVQENGNGDPYHNMGMFTGKGGYLFKQLPDGSYDPKDVGLASPGGLEAAQWFADASKAGLISKDVTYDIMISSFGSGKAPFAITGPWATSDKDKGFKAKGVPYVVEPLPPLKSGVTPAVFVGVQGFMVSAFSKKQDLAKTFLLDYINTPEVMTAIYKAGGRPPAMTSVLQTASSDPDIQGFSAAGKAGVPLPQFPFMSKVFDTWTAAYAAVFQGKDPQATFKAANDAILAVSSAG